MVSVNIIQYCRLVHHNEYINSEQGLVAILHHAALTVYNHHPNNFFYKKQENFIYTFVSQSNLLVLMITLATPIIVTNEAFGQ